MSYNSDEKFMKEAIKEAVKSVKCGDVPVGCIIVGEDGSVIARAHNEREKKSDATAHAEITAIKKAGIKLGRWNLSGTTMYVTLEPCVMCAGAAVNARIGRIVYGAKDLRFGCCGTVYNLAGDEKFNHRCKVEGGVLEPLCLAPLQEFFKKLREEKKKTNNCGKKQIMSKNSESERLNS